MGEHRELSNFELCVCVCCILFASLSGTTKTKSDVIALTNELKLDDHRATNRSKKRWGGRSRIKYREWEKRKWIARVTRFVHVHSFCLLAAFCCCICRRHSLKLLIHKHTHTQKQHAQAHTYICTCYERTRTLSCTHTYTHTQNTIDIGATLCSSSTAVLLLFSAAAAWSNAYVCAVALFYSCLSKCDVNVFVCFHVFFVFFFLSFCCRCSWTGSIPCMYLCGICLLVCIE